MATTLPHPLQLRLDQTLAQWRHWDCQPPLSGPPPMVRQLDTGRSNHSFLVGTGRRFVLRLDGINPASNGLNRQAEWSALHTAHSAGLAPRPNYFNPELGALVCAYLPPESDQPLRLAELARLLRQIHQLPPSHYRLDLRERIGRYQHQLEQLGGASANELLQFRQPIARLLEPLQDSPVTPVFCHNDLLRANRLYSGGKLWALDWEYSAMGSPWFDLAVICSGDELDATATAQLTECYLQRPAHEAERDLVARYGCVYRYLELLWHRTSGGQPLADSTAKTAALALTVRTLLPEHG